MSKRWGFGVYTVVLGIFFPVQWEKLHQNINGRWLWPRHTKFCVSTPHNHKRLLLQGPDPNKIKHWCRTWEQDSTEQNEVKLQVLKCLPKVLQYSSASDGVLKEHFDTKPNSSYAQWPLAACPTQTVKKPHFKTPSSNEKKSVLQISLQRLFLC